MGFGPGPDRTRPPGPTGRHGQRRRRAGFTLAVNLVGRGNGMTDSAAARPRDAREAILLGRKPGWAPAGRGTSWPLPEHGLKLAARTVIPPDTAAA
ncbi:hypothetical protein MYMAC_000897 [Corallococcus macrosporus DSM 14697]|uniref:Uncharacterized protein n=2 Tax=Corallococcus macrosporus TaxID=35 RepID=A0A250JPB2_9BACT|nr:hypothetical protein MYMAC_000897 [Corallococcus macrosporus DSM 14697]